MRKFEWESGAQEALYEARAIRPSKRHYDIFVRTYDAEAERGAYAIRTAMLERSGDMRWRREFLDEVADVLERTEDTCFICDAAREPGDD
jgi:hypothetical protein